MGPDARTYTAGPAKNTLLSDCEQSPLHPDLEDAAASQISSRGAWRAQGPLVGVLLGTAALCAAGSCLKLAWAAVEHGVREEATAVREEATAMPDLSLLYPKLPMQELPTYEIPLRGGWINMRQRRGLSVNATNMLPRNLRDRRLAAGNCRDRLDRFLTFGNNPLVAGAPDPLFPAVGASIAPPGANCGDSAAGIHESCDKYNKWSTFQAVAQDGGVPFQVIGPEGPKWKDVGQGELGNCYFLAALASIAYSDPYVIEGMFVKREKWDQNIFTTKWLLNGHITEVEVDNNVPAESGGSTFFTQPSRTGEWWPVILEKAWSKIFGSYRATEGGHWPNAVLAMTGAPVLGWSNADVTEDDIWKRLQEATVKGWPMGAGTGNGGNAKKYRIPDTHAYALLRAFEDPSYGKVVEVYNPHGKDEYTGAIPNPDHNDGLFNMTLSEYKEAFGDTSVGKVHDANFKITSKLVQTENSKASAWEFSMASAGDFYVSITWPTARMLEPCTELQPAVTLAVAKKDSPAEMASLTEYGVNSAPVLVTKGTGDYVVTQVLAFPPTDKVYEAHLVIYAPEAVTLTQSAGNPDDALLALLAASQGGKACSPVVFEHRGIFALRLEERVNGVPTFWSHDGADFAYWFPKEERWLTIQASELQKVKAGSIVYLEKFSKAQMSCGCSDAPKGVAGFDSVLCNEVKPPHTKYGNVQCDGKEYSTLVQRYCPKTCNVPICSNTPTLGKAPAPEVPAPTPAPTPEAPGAGQGATCADQEHPGIKVNGVAAASCSDLAVHCLQWKVIEDRCCATCANKARGGGVSDEDVCADYKPPGIRDDKGKKIKDCSSVKEHCENSEAVRQRCCGTCKAASAMS